MFRKLILIFFLFLFCGSRAFADTFVVTSNADSGPGTLREALTLAAANGSAVKDYINFNLPDLSVAGRTITLVTQLPDVSSNLEIDGSTQTGNKFGVSDAKVGLFYNTPIEQSLSGFFIKDQHDVSILGFHIKNLSDVRRASLLYFWKAIEIINSSNIEIGRQGKGNVATNFYFAIITNFSGSGIETRNITIKDNLFGVDADGETLSTQPFQQSMLFDVYDQVNIGGNSLEGNLFATGLLIYETNTHDDSPSANILIKNNKIGVDYNTQLSTLYGLELMTITPGGKNTINIEDNVLGGTDVFGPLYASNGGRKLTILRNYIGTDRTLTRKLELTSGVQIFNYQGDVQIGSNNPADANYIAYCKPLNFIETFKVSFNKNSIFCAHDLYPIYSYSYYTPLTTVTINNIADDVVSGVATPNSTIELFYTDQCGTCSPKTYFGTTRANTSGQWQYNGPISGSVIASATYNRSTSEFTNAYLNASINDDDIIKTQPNCLTANGSIKNIKVAHLGPGNNTYTYSWKNSNNNEVGTSLDLNNVPAGTYTLEVKGLNCGSAFSDPIVLESKEITFDLTQKVQTNAGCNNQTTGSITGITASNATKFEWRDANNNLVGNNPDLKNVPAGAYRLTASNDFGCSKTSQVYQILELPGTTYPAYTFTRKNTCFGETNGSISVTADAKVKSLRWVNGLNQTISGNQQISDLAAGTYKLYFTDQNDCESLYNSYTINEIPQLQIIPNTEQKTDDECDLKTGSIKNIQITGGLQPYVYEWYNANNEQVSTGVSPTGLSAGNYKLIVNDASGCAEAIASYSITAHSSIIAAPSANDVQLCTSGNALLTVNSAVAGYTYRLYESVNSITPLAQQANGRFTINAKTSTAFYISQVSGGCESSRTKVQVTISLSAIHIANAFTPNGDGINDYWKIEGIENYPNAQIQVFNRYGQKLFESKGYPVPFNGTSKGNLLANGAYYYIINLNKNCSLLSGYLSIIR